MKKKIKYDLKLIIAIGLILISNLGLIGWIVPAFPLDVKVKAILAPGLIIFGHIAYNLGLLLAGAHVIGYLKKKKINPMFLWNQLVILYETIKHFFHSKIQRKKSK